MAEFSAVSPLLDGFTVGECFSSRDGVSCYALRHDASGQDFVLKHISVPDSEAKIQALLLSGAYAGKEEVNEYFKRVADAYAEEFTLSKSLADCPYILPYLAHQVVEREEGAGYDVYAICDKATPLRDYLAENAMTKLQAVNLGIDLCTALCAIRSAGYLHQNIKPENIYIRNDRFLLGDLGLTAVQDMKYSSLPEQYIGQYTAPELHDIMAEQNETTDLYAVGMLLYRIYNGDHAPYEDEQVTAKEADRMRLSGKELPAPMYADYELAEILLKACAFKKEDRYQTPQEMKRELEFYMQRNGTADTLIVPPIVSDPVEEITEEPLSEEEAVPVRFADVSAMDEDFIRHFAPDTAMLDAAIAQMKQEDAEEAARAGETAETLPEKPVLPEQPEEGNEAEQPEPETEPEEGSEAEQPEPEDAPEAAPEEAPETEPASEDEAVSESEEAAPIATDRQPLVICGMEAPEDADEADVEEKQPEMTSQDLVTPEDGLPDGKPFDEPNAELTMIEDEHSAHAAAGERKHSRHHRSKGSSDDRSDAYKVQHRKRITRRTILGVLLLLLVAAVFIYFFTPLGQKIYHYTINIEQLAVTDSTAESLTVRLQTNVSKPPITLSCTDSYGNRFDAPLRGSTAEFTGLESGRQYTVTAALKEDAGLHRLTGTTSLTASTLPSTEILVMSATAGNEEGAANIDIVVKEGDPEPSSWTISYCCEGGTSQERSFRGGERSFRITGLEVGKEYTFTLVSSDLFKIEGETSAVFTPVKAVTAEKLKMASFVDGILTVGWECTSDAPEGWTVTATDPDGKEKSVETTECTASVRGLKVGTPYTVRLEAEGLFVPLTLEIPDTLLHVDSMKATEEKDGIHVEWSCPAAPEESSWILVSVACNNGDTVVAHNVDGNSAVLTGLLPDTPYTLWLRSADELTTVGHNTVEYTMPKPEHFDTRGITEGKTTLTTYAVPEEEGWKAKTLETAKTAFDVSDKIAYKLTARTGRYQGSFNLLYVLRNENGVPVDFGTEKFVWNEVWAWDNGSEFSMAGTVDAPDKNGTYTLELYFSLETNGYIHYKSVATSAPITVTGAAEE